MIIDFHTHIWPDKAAEKAKIYLQKAFKTEIVTVPSVNNLLNFMDKAQVDMSVALPVASRPDQVEHINNWIFSIKNERLNIFGSLHPYYKNWEDELKRIRDNSFGIKFQPEFQDFYADSEDIFPIYEKMQEYGLILVFHTGDELTGTGKVHCSPEAVSVVHKKFPDLKIISAHMGGVEMWEDSEKYLAGENIFLDTSYSVGRCKDDVLQKIIKKHGEDRIVFGTDFPLVEQSEDILKTREFFKDLCDLDKIFALNAKKLLNL